MVRKADFLVGRGSRPIAKYPAPCRVHDPLCLGWLRALGQGLVSYHPKSLYHGTRQVSQLLSELSITLPLSLRIPAPVHTRKRAAKGQRTESIGIQPPMLTSSLLVAWHLYAGHIVFGRPRMRDFLLDMGKLRGLYMYMQSAVLAHTKQLHTDPNLPSGKYIDQERRFQYPPSP
ncbi:hypothetical protein CONLIGDRAFT_353286 [Coniochaeta ligniaria NRRL 30616]|uniref:Uncharacterized protein n=1 Tax=Coniochaeta ligniaria NRRL 30616 TaxID=1408157 RepID=A0A1J7IRJ2_9PEZI|nr:hypothetical protein CONLIGDRAFT_353286 [Coniochaeta ligniaria NRRL 30616]